MIAFKESHLIRLVRAPDSNVHPSQGMVLYDDTDYEVCSDLEGLGLLQFHRNATPRYSDEDEYGVVFTVGTDDTWTRTEAGDTMVSKLVRTLQEKVKQ